MGFIKNQNPYLATYALEKNTDKKVKNVRIGSRSSSSLSKRPGEYDKVFGQSSMCAS